MKKELIAIDANPDATAYVTVLLAAAHGDPHAQTRYFIKWIEAGLRWEQSGILESLAATGEPVRGLTPGDLPDTIDLWAN